MAVLRPPSPFFRDRDRGRKRFEGNPRSNSRAAGALLAAALLASCAGGRPPRKDPASIPRFASRTIEVPGPARSVYFLDVDGAPSDDLVVLTATTALVLRRGGESTLELPLPAGWTLARLEPRPGGSGRDLLVFGPAGVDRFDLSAARPRAERIVEAAFPSEPPPAPDWTLLFPGAFEAGTWSADADRDGWVDVLVPDPEDAGFELVRGGPAGWSRAGRLRVPDARPSPGWIPPLLPCDYDGDGRPDLVVSTPEGLWFFPGLAERPAARLAWEGRAAAADLDGDGLPDFVLSDPSGERYLVHRGRRGSPPAAEPDLEFVPEGDHRFGPYLADADGDGVADLAWLEIDEPGFLRAGLAALFAGAVPVDVDVATAGAGEVRRESFTAYLDLSLLEGELAELASSAKALADLDRDGRLDLVLLDADDDLALLYDVEGADEPAPSGPTPLQAIVARTVYVTLDAAAGLPDRAPDRTIDVPPAFEPEAVAVETGDLDGDGHADLLLWEPGRVAKVVVLASRGGESPPP